MKPASPSVKSIERDAVAIIRKWRKILHIDPVWKIQINVHEVAYDIKAANCDAIAMIDADERSWHAVLDIHAFNLDKDHPLEDTLVHELLHILMVRYERAVSCGFADNNKKLGLDIVESHTERLAFALLAAHRG